MQIAPPGVVGAVVEQAAAPLVVDVLVEDEPPEEEAAVAVLVDAIHRLVRGGALHVELGHPPILDQPELERRREGDQGLGVGGAGQLFRVAQLAEQEEHRDDQRQRAGDLGDLGGELEGGHGSGGALPVYNAGRASDRRVPAARQASLTARRPVLDHPGAGVVPDRRAAHPGGVHFRAEPCPRSPQGHRPQEPLRAATAARHRGHGRGLRGVRPGSPRPRGGQGRPPGAERQPPGRRGAAPALPPRGADHRQPAPPAHRRGQGTAARTRRRASCSW